MKDNDNDLLDFEAVNPLDAISDDEGDEDDDEEIEKEVPSDDDSEEEPTLGKVKGSKIEITKSLVKKWNQQLDKPTLRLQETYLLLLRQLSISTIQF